MLLPLPANPTSPTRMALHSSPSRRSDSEARAGPDSDPRPRRRGTRSAISQENAPAHRARSSWRHAAEARLEGIEASLQVFQVVGGRVEVAEPDAIEGVDDQARDVGHGLGVRPAPGQEDGGPARELVPASRRAGAPGRTRPAAAPAAGRRPRRPRARPPPRRGRGTSGAAAARARARPRTARPRSAAPTNETKNPRHADQTTRSSGTGAGREATSCERRAHDPEALAASLASRRIGS